MVLAWFSFFEDGLGRVASRGGGAVGMVRGGRRGEW